MKGPALLIAAAIVACGCAQTPSTGEATADDAIAAGKAGNLYANEDRVCERIRRTGTNRAVVVCRTRAEIERDATESKRTFDDLRNSQMNSGELGGYGDGRQ